MKIAHILYIVAHLILNLKVMLFFYLVNKVMKWEKRKLENTNIEWLAVGGILSSGVRKPLIFKKKKIRKKKF